jgi:integrase
LKINRITTARIEKFIVDRQNQGMNISTIKKILVTLGQIMAYAVRHKYIDYNPARDAEKPRKGNTKKQKIRVLTPDEINALIDAESDLKYKILFQLAIFSGARQGELLGLKWSDVDWENSQIHIQRTFNNDAWYYTKTDTSDRKIDLGPAMMTALKKWKLACPTSKLNLVFPNKAENPINHNNLVNRHFNPALKAAGIPKIRFHDLRHTYDSLLIEQGENIKYIQSQLGHSSPSVTLNIYAHLMKSVNQEAACRLENTIFETSGSKMVAEKKKEVLA